MNSYMCVFTGFIVYREAKPSMTLTTPTSPVLTSPVKILSTHSPSAVSHTSSNAASNFIYDNRGDDDEIQAKVRWVLCLLVTFDLTVFVSMV